MPRNGSGTSSVINTFVIDTVADPDEVNANFTDVADQLTNSLPRDGQAGMNAPLPLENGTSALPALTFSSDPNTGIYRKEADAVAIAGNGADLAVFSPKGNALPSQQGHIFGLTLSNNAGDATNDIDIAAGSAGSDTSPFYLMTLAAALTKRLDAAWAVGTNQGGLDTGAIANTTYHVWLIQRSDTGVVDALFSTSATAPTMPTNYDRKRRIGAIIRAAAAILPFIQHEDTFWHNNATTNGIVDVNVTNPGTSAATRTLASIPTGIQTDAIINLGVNNTSGASSVTTATPLELAAVTPGSTFASGLWNGTPGTGSAIGVQGRVRTNTSAQIRTQTSVSGASLTLQIGTLGWVDTRGRFA